MAQRYKILTRCLAALALLFVYVASTSAILVGGTTTSAQARGGRGYGRGYARGYGRGARAVLDAMEAGEDYRQVAERHFPGGSFGNGAAMRVAPGRVQRPRVQPSSEAGAGIAVGFSVVIQVSPWVSV